MKLNRIYRALWRLVCVVPLALATTTATAADALQNCANIWPVGDSITLGAGFNGGYRNQLYTGLAAQNCGVDLIGTLSTANDSSDPNLPPIGDGDHDGRSGISIGGVGQGFGAWLDAIQTPNAVLLMIGTNDTIWSPSESAVSIAARHNALIDQLQAAAKLQDAWIFVATIPPQSSNAGQAAVDRAVLTHDFNNAVRANVQERVTAGESVRLVDVEPLLSVTADMYDGIHPNASGHAKIAQKFLEVISEALGGGGPSEAWTASATHSPSSPTPSASVTANGTVRHTFAAAQTVNVQTMVKDATTGNSIGQSDCTNVTLQPNTPFTCPHTAVYSAGSYKIEVGVFPATWGSPLLWLADADFFTVGSPPSGPVVRFDFEGSTQGWQVTSGQAPIFRAFASGPSFGHGGAYALQLQSLDSSTAQVAATQTAPLPSFGNTVTFYLAASNPMCIANVKPFVQFGAASNWTWLGTFVSGDQLMEVQSDQWLQVQVPINQGSGQVFQIGIEVNLNAGCTNTSVYLDDVSW